MPQRQKSVKFQKKTHILKNLGELKEFVDDITPSLENMSIYRDLSKINGSILFVGDLHGFFNNVIDAIKLGIKKSVAAIVFLGDYVDRGPHQLKTLLNIFYAFARSNGFQDSKKFEFIDPIFSQDLPFQIIALRGNHEDISQNIGSFESEMLYDHDINKFPKELFTRLYEHLPVMAKTRGKTLCVHGGIPKLEGEENSLVFVKSLKNTYTPWNGNPKNSWTLRKIQLTQELLWNDPDENMLAGKPKYLPSIRGGSSYRFNKTAFINFLDDLGCNKMIRSHEAARGPYQSLWDDRLIHIFSAYPYFGKLSTSAYYLEDSHGSGEFLDRNGKVLK